MIFGPQLVTAILEGRKTVTRRRLTHRDGRDIRYQVGKVYAVQPGRGKAHVGHILVRDVKVEPLGALDNADARREGFADTYEFARYWLQLHGGLMHWSEPVAVIRFELAPSCPKCARSER